MKRFYLSFFILILVLSCNPYDQKIKQLQTQIDSLQNRLNNAYVPGFGEFMSGIQVHHAKLWFAGTNQNWDLADFELNEIQELKDDIVKFETERVESRTIPMLQPALDSMALTIKRKNLDEFKNSFMFLTNTCNECHRVVNYPFNDVKIPDTSPFTNQIFKPGMNK